jgi:hypothetical protein
MRIEHALDLSRVSVRFWHQFFSNVIPALSFVSNCPAAADFGLAAVAHALRVNDEKVVLFEKSVCKMCAMKLSKNGLDKKEKKKRNLP